MMNRLAISAVITAVLASPTLAQQLPDFSKAEVKLTSLTPNLYLLKSVNEGNILVLTGPDGVLLLDDSYAQMFDKITAAVAKVSGGKAIRFVINSHIHGDHIGGNELMEKAGATVIAHENVRSRMIKGGYNPVFNQTIQPAAPGALPQITYTDKMTIHFDGETIELIHAPPSHTDSDTIVYFKNANVLDMGGVYGNNKGYPFVDQSSGGVFAGVIAAEEKVLPLINEKTRIFADQGEAENKKTLQASHDMLVAVRDRIQKLIDEGKSEDEVVAAKPTKDFDKAWAKGPFLTGDFMAREAYRSLKGIAPPSAPPATAPAKSN